MAAMVVSATFGIVREMLLAREFGTARETDAYFFTFDCLMGVVELLLAGADAALIPLYACSKREKDGISGTFASTVINVYLLVLLVSSGLFAVLAPLIGHTLTSGFDPMGEALVISLMWSLSPAILLLGLWMILRLLLQAEHRFFVSQVSTSFSAIAVIVSILLLLPFMGIYSLAAGILVGATAQVVWSAYWLWRAGFRYRPVIDLRHSGFRRFLVLLWPAAIAALVSVAAPILDKSMASHLPEGSVACLGFAARPMSLVMRFGLYALITALLPTLSWCAVNQDQGEFREGVTRLLGILITVSIPLGFIFVGLRVPLIRVLFERGSFGPEATTTTANIFGSLVIGLAPTSVAVALATVFSSLQDTKTVAFVGGGSMLVTKVAFNFLLIGPLGVVGLALSSSLQYLLPGILMMLRLRHRLNGIGARRLMKISGKALLASLPAFVVVQAVATGINMAPLLQCMLGALAGAAAFIGFALLLRMTEVWESWELISRYARWPAQNRDLAPPIPPLGTGADEANL